MAAVVDIYNRSLQLLGAKRISIPSESSQSARACRACYEPLRDSLLRRHKWNFAITRASLAAEDPAPSFGRGNSYPLPSDYIQMANEYPERNTLARDFVVEAGKIVSNWSDPLEIRYVKRVTDPNVMDPLFRELLAHDMALAMCEELTQSSTKKESLRADRREIYLEARKANAFEKPAEQSPEDEWVTVRS